MIIKPSIRSNVFTNAHPHGCYLNVKTQIDEAKNKPSFEGPKNVLIIGGSSGYGLASRIALAYGAGANTLNVSYEGAPKGKRTGTAGWWNNIYFQELAKETGNIHKDFVGDAFSVEMKNNVIAAIKEQFGTVDLIIYSLAAGARKDSETGEVIKSAIKPVGEAATGKTIDIANREVSDLTIEPATAEEINSTVKVMGGSDWKAWIDALDNAGVMDNNAKTIAYTYIGSNTTKSIYRGGTLGYAKTDLENTAKTLNETLQSKYDGEALISSSKGVVTKASVFIPQMPIYVSALYEVMMNEGIHESILAHKYRLYQDMVYGENRTTDNEGRLRMDAYELDPSIQEKTEALMRKFTDASIFEMAGTRRFLKDFYQINGFDFDAIDYEAPVDMDALAEKLPE